MCESRCCARLPVPSIAIRSLADFRISQARLLSTVLFLLQAKREERGRQRDSVLPLYSVLHFVISLTSCVSVPLVEKGERERSQQPLSGGMTGQRPRCAARCLAHPLNQARERCTDQRPKCTTSRPPLPASSPLCLRLSTPLAPSSSSRLCLVPLCPCSSSSPSSLLFH